MRTLLVSLIVLLGCISFGHKPRFIEGAGPFTVEEPTISQAFYHQFTASETYSFVVPPLPVAVPVEVLILDNALGQSLDFEASWICEGSEMALEAVDVPFFEEFSRINHRYRVVDGVGPTSSSCEIRVTETTGQAAPYVFAIGEIESFGFNDVMGFLTLGDKLKKWQAFPNN
jgi:hypothetical protein